MAEAALRSGRRPEDVSLIAVSKTFPLDAVREAYAAGQRLFGENKVQELLQKAVDGHDMADIEWHLIGHLQSNKARKAATAAHVIHVVDSPDLLQRIDRAATEAWRLGSAATNDSRRSFSTAAAKGSRSFCQAPRARAVAAGSGSIGRSACTALRRQAMRA